MTLWRAKSSALSNAPAADSPPFNHRAGESPPTAQKRRIQPGQIIGAEAAHRQSADRDTTRIGAQQADGPWDHLIHHVAAPRPIFAVVPVGVFAPVGKDDIRCPRSQLRKSGEELTAQVGVLILPLAVQEDEQRLPSIGAARGNHGCLGQRLMHERAVDREMDYPRAVGVDTTQGRREHGSDADDDYCQDKQRHRPASAVTTILPCWLNPDSVCHEDYDTL